MSVHKKPKPANQPSKVLSNSENQELFNLLGPKCVAMATGVVQVFLANPPTRSQWSKKCVGVASFVKDNPKRSYFIRVYDINAGSCIWEQEIYNQFKYKEPRPYFHTFDTDDCPAGLNFCNEDDAKAFAKVVQEKLRERYQRKMDRRKTGAQGAGGQRSNISRPAAPPPAPDVATPNPPVVIPASNSGKGTLKGKDKKSKKGKLDKKQIGAPTDFRHVGHVGWNAEKGVINVDKLDPDLKDLFDQCGITDNQLQDEATVSFIYDFIEQRGGLEQVKKERKERPPPPPVPKVPPVGDRAPAPPPGSRGPVPPPPRAAASPPVMPSMKTAPIPPPARSPIGPIRGTAPPRLPARTPSFGPPPIPPTNRPQLCAPAQPPPRPPMIPSVAPPAIPPTAPPLAPPVAPPLPPNAPPAPPAPTPPPAPTGPPMGVPAPQSGRGDLLEQIRGGATLRHRKESDHEASSGDSRANLMEQIRGGFQLKQVDTIDNRKSAECSSEGGLAGALAAALATRFTGTRDDDADSDDDDDDDDVDDDEWDE